MAVLTSTSLYVGELRRSAAGGGSGEATLNGVWPGGGGQECAKVRPTPVCRGLWHLLRK